MILTFSDQQFEQKIMRKEKIHTIREDKTDRWKVGMKIHAWMHNPRNVQKNPHPIDVESLYVVSIQIIEIKIQSDIMVIWIDKVLCGLFNLNSNYSSDIIKELVKNDGFRNIIEFYNFFKPRCPFSGKLIHWTDFKY